MGERNINPLFNTQDKYREMNIINPYKFDSGGGTTLKDGLVYVLELDEISGTIAYDSHASNDATNVGAAVNQAGIIGTSYNFTSNYLTLPSITQQTGSFSISTWYNADTYNGVYPGLYGGYSLGTQTIQGGIALCFYTSLNRLYFDVYSATNRYSATWLAGTLPSTGQWHHVVATYDLDWLRLYVDNTLVASTQIGSIVIDWSNANATPPSIGRTRQSSNYYYFDGKIDQSSLWNRALDTNEISTLYNSGNGLPYTSW